MPIQIQSFDPRHAAIIVVDMENDFVAAGASLETPMGRAFVPQLHEFLEACRAKGIFVVYTTHVHREDGTDMGRFADIWAVQPPFC